MFTKSYAVAAALVAAANAVSRINIHNGCDHPVTIFKRQGSQPTGPKITKQPGEPLEEDCTGDAVSYLILDHDSDDPCGPGHPCTQLEYSENSSLYYDMSNINGYPFPDEGMTLTPSGADTSSSPTCKSVECAAGATTCDGAYNLPDDVRTLVCPVGVLLTLDLCNSGNAGSGSDSGSDGGYGAPAATPVASPAGGYSAPAYTAPAAATGGYTPPTNQQPYVAPQPQVPSYQEPAQQYQPPTQRKYRSTPQQYSPPQQQQYNPVRQRPNGEVYAQAYGNDQPTVTSMVTAYQYVNKREAETAAPEPVPKEKRHAHAHRHAHAGSHGRA